MFNILKYFFFFSFLFSVTQLFPQELETLKSELPSLKDRQKADQYLKIGILYAEKYGKPDSVLYYSSLAEDLSRKINYTAGFLKSQLQNSIGFQQKNQFDTSIVILQKLLSERELGSSNLEGDVHYHLGISYYRSGDGKNAIENFIKAIPFYKNKSDYDGLILTYCKLCDVFESDSQHKESNEYKNKALELLEKPIRPYTKIAAFNILSSIYFDLRENSQNNLDTSIVFAEEAFRLMKEYGYYMKANQILNTIADAYYVKKDYNTSLLYCKESLKYRKFLFPGEIIISYTKFADCANALNKNDLALVYLDSTRIALKQINVQYYWLGYYQRCYELNRKVGNHEQAFLAIDRFNALKDSMYTVEKSTAINELMQKYNKVENEKTIGELNQQKEIDKLQIRSLVAFTGIAILVIIIIIFFYRQSVVKNKLKTIEIEQRLNRSRMNPHFFFNALASLQNLSLSEAKKELVPSFISKFSRIMRQSLESTFHELDTIENEIIFLTDYLELQKLLSENRFNYSFEVDDAVEQNELLIPGMILQPFIENSIEHGFKGISQEGLVSISFTLEGKSLNITITDNGRGVKENEKHKAYPSRAMQIIRDRLYLLNQTHKTNATFALTNLEVGTKIEITLPVIYRS
jgi:two-component sensor histidine kinase/tetratricopeptide (TPR) repeat protein